MKRIFCTILYFAVAFNLFPQKAYDNFPALIAHGGGRFNSEIYTNCVEALESSLQAGYKYVELDLLLSSDGYIFAAHDWEMFNENTGYPELGDAELSLEEIESRKLYSKYTPITYKEIIAFFEKNPDWVLVTDKIDDPLILDEFFISYKERIIVEAFSLDAYYELREAGYNTMVSMNNEVQHTIAWSVENMIQGGAPIDFVTVHYTNGCEELSKFKCLFPLKIAAYTVNDEEFVSDHLGNEFVLIYTDLLK